MHGPVRQRFGAADIIYKNAVDPARFPPEYGSEDQSERFNVAEGSPFVRNFAETRFPSARRRHPSRYLSRTSLLLLRRGALSIVVFPFATRIGIYPLKSRGFKHLALILYIFRCWRLEW
ncbi:hypothetical protein EMEDMD4_210011 [Sinorhizobium medicae]|uniref:Uncharacterized protein n=1 Tax=Sinorhizobium medicae TaxID=110321 RepID=A0A508WTH8_9HYPH|nr:hypothetical protein EMEDMD4_210011 [Sinorhizobium medicae]